ncbi:MAG: O-antigen ligase family protein [Candidatus Micrarchaeaceae archaeon]
MTSWGIDPLEKMFWGLLIFSLPFTDIEFPRQARGFGQPSSYLTIVLWVLVLLRILRRRESLRFLKGKAFLFMFLFWVVAGISISQSLQAPPSPWFNYSSPWTASIEQFIQLSVALSIVFFTAFFVRSWRDFRFAMTLYFAGWIGSVFAQGLDFAAYFDTRSNMLLAVNDFIHHTGWWQFLGPIPRLRLSTAEASWASDYLLCLIPFFALRAYYWKSRMWNTINAAAAVLILFGTMSFGGLAVFLGEGALMALALGRRAAGFLVLAGAAPLFLALAISPIYVTWVWNRAVGVIDYGVEARDFSVRQRTALVEAAWAAFKEHPWLGVGIGNSTFYVVGDMPGWAITDPAIKSALQSPAGANICNFDLQILSETGLVGSGLLLALLATMIWETFTAWRHSSEPWKKSVYAAVLVALLGQIAHYVSMNRFFCHYWFFIWGLAICAPRLLAQKDPKMPERRVIIRKMTPRPREPRQVGVLP